MGRVRDLGNKSTGAVQITDHANLLDGETITIGDPENGGFVFEFDDDAAVEAGAILVDTGADEDEAIENLVAAINANLGSILLAYVDPEDTMTCRIEGASEGALGNLAFETDFSDAGNTIAASGDDTLSGGSNDENRSRASGIYEVTALDVLAENVMIPTPFAAPVIGRVMVLDAAGVMQYITDEITISTTRLKITKAGGTNLAAGDLVHWEVWSGE